MTNPMPEDEVGKAPHTLEVRVRKTIQRWATISAILAAVIVAAGGFGGQVLGAYMSRNTQHDVVQRQIDAQDRVLEGQIDQQHRNFMDEQLALAYTNFLNSTESLIDSVHTFNDIMDTSSDDGKHFRRISITSLENSIGAMSRGISDMQIKWGVISLIAPSYVTSSCTPDFAAMTILPGDAGDLIRTLKRYPNLTQGQYNSLLQGFIKQVNSDQKLDKLVKKFEPAPEPTVGVKENCDDNMRKSLDN